MSETLPKRGRGRGRGAAATPGHSTAPPHGRGRARGRIASEQQSPPQHGLGAPLLSVRGAARSGPQVQALEKRPISTQGTSGRQLMLSTNYVRVHVTNTPGQQLVFQYHVQFTPEVASAALRGGILYNMPELKDNIIFSDQTLYSHQDLGGVKVLSATLQRENTPVSILLTKTLELPKDSPHFANVFFNHVVARHMDLVRIQRDYFNPNATKDLPQHHLRIMPG